MAAALRSAERDPARVTDAEAMVLFEADGAELEALCGLADDVRRDAVGEVITYVVNRSISLTKVAEVGARAHEACLEGATEVCMQGEIDPTLSNDAYFQPAREVKCRVPGMHVHAFSPVEIVHGAARLGVPVAEFLAELRSAGVDSVRGTAAEILDESVRGLPTEGKVPAASWIEVIIHAHEAGLRSSSTMMYGHLDHPAHWLAHLRSIARIQSETRGFTEFVGVPCARAGPTGRENRIVHAMARLLLHGLIDDIQVSGVELGVAGAQQVLRGGANDLGGTLSATTVENLVEIAAGIGRPAVQRTSLHGHVPPGRRGVG